MSQLTDLSVEECLGLIRTHVVGRIALRTPEGLRIFPVNYSVVGDDIYIRTLPYGSIANNAHQAEVAFEVDRVDEQRHSGWSVLAAGTARRLEDPDEVKAVRGDQGPQPWADGQRNLYFKIECEQITGRRIEPRTDEGSSVFPQSRLAPPAGVSRTEPEPRSAQRSGPR